MADTGRVFPQGGSQSLRIPKDFRFPDTVTSVRFFKNEHGQLVLEPVMIDADAITVRAMWADDPRAAFESMIPQPMRVMNPREGMERLLNAGVLPIRSEPNGSSDGLSVAPWQSARWSFELEGHGWLDAWALLGSLKHEEYLVVALVGLGFSLDRIAYALTQVATESAWGGLGAVGWLWAYSRQEGVPKGEGSWASHLKAVATLARQVNGGDKK